MCWPCPVSLAVAERGQDGDRRVEAADHVGNGDPHLHRLAVRIAGDAHHPAHPLDQEVVAGLRRVRAGLAEAGDRAVDEAGEGGTEVGVGEAEAGHVADLEILDQHVGAGGEVAHQRLSFLLAEVDGQ